MLNEFNPSDALREFSPTIPDVAGLSETLRYVMHQVATHM
ncbi:uncharacterized protein METZ01_LOCUS18104 [marine metagenome]|uniref:Uncharacterized protein n=1 Tax=marine metagenome TaxID=408172 RepID=A0A381PE99_9ZZZZ